MLHPKPRSDNRIFFEQDEKWGVAGRLEHRTAAGRRCTSYNKNVPGPLPTGRSPHMARSSCGPEADCSVFSVRHAWTVRRWATSAIQERYETSPVAHMQAPAGELRLPA